MDLKYVRSELTKLAEIIKSWNNSGDISALDRDLVLEKLRTLYDAVRFGTESTAETMTEPATGEYAIDGSVPTEMPVSIDLDEVLALDAVQVAEFEENQGAVPGTEEPELGAEREIEPEPDSEMKPATASDEEFTQSEAPASVFESGSDADVEPDPDVVAVPDDTMQVTAQPETEAEVAEETTAESALDRDEEDAVSEPPPSSKDTEDQGVEPTPETEPAAASVAQTLFGLEPETDRHHHKQRVIMSLYDTEASDRTTPENPMSKASEIKHFTSGKIVPQPVGGSETVPDSSDAADSSAADNAAAQQRPDPAVQPERRAYQAPEISDEDDEPDFEEVIIEVTGNSATVLGEVINHNVQTLADTIAPPRDRASELRNSEPVTDLRRAIGINDKFLMIRDLFGGDGAAYEAAIEQLNAFDDLDDCMIYIAENYAWNANSDGAKFLMELLERKLA